MMIARLSAAASSQPQRRGAAGDGAALLADGRQVMADVPPSSRMSSSVGNGPEPTRVV